ncbi:MAG: Fic family protein [Treponema sp.]|nr:Fic family protein [Treponema sp.]
MHKFDYSFLNNGMLPSGLVNVTASISSLKTASQFRKNDFQKVFTELEKIAKIQSVKSSNEIEGIVTTDERIVQIVHQNSAPLNHNEEEILGYRDALNIIHTGHQDIQFNENTVLSLHRIMLSSTNYSYGGRYKTDDNVILEIDSQGNKKVRFAPVPAEDTKSAMEQLFFAFMEASSDSNINALLLIPCVILDFLCIHPFRDGNGRMSRLLSLLLLYKSGFDVGKYISFEEQINKNKGWYYQSLKESSEEWHESKNNYFPFMQNFLSTLYVCYQELDKRFAVVNSNKITKTSRIESTVLNSLLPISKAEICKLLPDISPTTVEAVLGKMVKSGIITTIGNGRATKYLRK